MDWSTIKRNELIGKAIITADLIDSVRQEWKGPGVGKAGLAKLSTDVLAELIMQIGYFCMRMFSLLFNLKMKTRG